MKYQLFSNTEKIHSYKYHNMGLYIAFRIKTLTFKLSENSSWIIDLIQKAKIYTDNNNYFVQLKKIIHFFLLSTRIMDCVTSQMYLYII